MEETEQSDGSAASSDDGLSDRAKSILAFERQWWRHAGIKEAAIRTEFGLSPARYYQVLGRVMDSPDALRFDPMLIKRLLRMRHDRARARERRSLSSASHADGARRYPTDRQD